MTETTASREKRVRFDSERVMALHAEYKKVKGNSTRKKAWLAQQRKAWKAIEEVSSALTVTCQEAEYFDCAACGGVRGLDRKRA